MQSVASESDILDGSAESRFPLMLPLTTIQSWPHVHAIPSQAADKDEPPFQREGPAAARPLHTIVHAHVSTSCIRRGDDAERQFLMAIESRGWVPLALSYGENYLGHVDFRLGRVRAEIGEEVEGGAIATREILTVDVKALRSLRRGGALQNQLLFVEMHEDGWLLGGHAHVLAVQVCEAPCSFVLLDRVKLAAHALSQVDMNAPRVAWPEQCYRRLYRRAGRSKELISLIDLEGAVEYAGCGLI
jgi:hypothetical protein